jgi:hypothetical protein
VWRPGSGTVHSKWSATVILTALKLITCLLLCVVIGLSRGGRASCFMMRSASGMPRGVTLFVTATMIAVCGGAVQLAVNTNRPAASHGGGVGDGLSTGLGLLLKGGQVRLTHPLSRTQCLPPSLWCTVLLVSQAV